MNQTSNIQERRQELKRISAIAKELVKSGEVPTVNAGIIATYTDETHREFKTLQKWNQEGFKVKRGEKAFLVWGKPKQKQQAEENATPSEDETNFFPIAYLFSNAQVHKPE